MGKANGNKGKWSKVLSWILCVMIILGGTGLGIPTKVLYAADVQATKPTVGEGTVNSPYEITSEAELMWFRDAVNSGNNVAICAKLMLDIKSTETQWTRIGQNEAVTYDGIFDGNGHTISDVSFTYSSTLTATQTVAGAIFGYVGENAVIKNLTVSSATIKKGYYGAGIAIHNHGKIVNCHSKNLEVSSLNVSGGICAINYATGEIYGCSNVSSATGYKIATTGGNGSFGGGIVGNNFGKVANSYNIANVNSKCCGGVVGFNNASGTVNNCYSIGSLKNGTSGSMAGVIGKNVGTAISLYCDDAKDNASVAVQAEGGGSITKCLSVKSAYFTCGKVTYLLNESGSDDSVTWRQNLDNGGSIDEYPVLDNAHGIVYEVGTDQYSNYNGSPCKNGHTLVLHQAKVATCVADGNIAYYTCSVCNKYFSDAAGDKAITEAGTIIAATGHQYGTPVFDWKDDNGKHTATATITCSMCSTDTDGHSEVLSCDITSSTSAASCVAEGTTTYTASVTYNGQVYTSTDVVKGDKGQHTYGKPVFNWIEESGSCKVIATYTCTTSGCTDAIDGHTKSVPCTITTVSTTDATCTTDGSVTYKATVQSSTDSEQKTYTISAKGHNYTTVSAKDATCEEKGNIEYQSCSACGGKFDKQGNDLSDSQIEKAALGHDYSWKANADGTTHSEVCARCNKIRVTEEHSGGSATCHSKKACSLCHATYGEYLSHTYGIPTFEWTKTEDGYQVTAKASCMNSGCSNVVEDKSCTVTMTVTKKPTCVLPGDQTYVAIASLEENGTVRQYTDTRKVEGSVKALGHTLEHIAAVEVGKCVGDGNEEFWKCTVCQKYYKDEQATVETTLDEVTVKAPGHDQSGIKVNPNGTHSGTCTKCGKEFAEEPHKGGVATCVEQARCEVCNALYGDLDTDNHAYELDKPEYQWIKDVDTYRVQVVFTCSRCDESVTNHQKVVSSDASDITKNEIVQETCKNKGVVSYHFEKVIDGKTYQADQQDDIPMTDHQLTRIAAKKATCVEDGNTEYYCCSVCGRLFADEKGINEITSEDVVIPATGHDRSVTDNGDGTHSGKCNSCGQVFDRAKHTGGTATCVKRANCSVCGAEYGEYGDHVYGKPEFNWMPAEEGYTVKAVFSCSVCDDSHQDHLIQMECSVSDPVVVDATETTEGSKTYVASVVYNNEQYSDKRIDIIPVIKKDDDKKDDNKNDNNANDNMTTKPDDNKGQTQPGGQTPGSTTDGASNATETISLGEVITDNTTNATYKVVKAADGTLGASYVTSTKKNVTKVSIPNQIVINGVVYKVVAIENNAFANNKKLTSVTLGSNVERIGKKAFYGCKKLKKITIKTTLLNKKSVGAKAFKGIHAKATIKVPKKLRTSYKKLLKTKGIGSKVKVK